MVAEVMAEKEVAMMMRLESQEVMEEAGTTAPGLTALPTMAIVAKAKRVAVRAVLMVDLEAVVKVGVARVSEAVATGTVAMEVGMQAAVVKEAEASVVVIGEQRTSCTRRAVRLRRRSSHRRPSKPRQACMHSQLRRMSRCRSEETQSRLRRSVRCRRG